MRLVYSNLPRRGRKAKLGTPEALLQNFLDYAAEVRGRNDWDGQDWVGKEGTEVTVRKRVPLTISGFCTFMGVGDSYLWELKKTVRVANDPFFTEVIAWVESTIRADQIEGSMCGYYPERLVARLNQLAEKTDVTSNGETVSAAPTIVVQSEAARAALSALVGAKPAEPTAGAPDEGSLLD